MLAPIIFGALAIAPFDDPADAYRVQCGAAALFLLLRDRGREASLTDVETAIPSHETGASLEEMMIGAQKLGYPLEGRRLRPTDERCRLPFIILLHPVGGQAHYVVVKPLGNSNAVQIIDGATYPRVVTWNDLFRATVWRGIALVPVTHVPGWVRPVLLTIIAAGALCIIVPVAWRLRKAYAL